MSTKIVHTQTLEAAYNIALCKISTSYKHSKWRIHIGYVLNRIIYNSRYFYAGNKAYNTSEYGYNGWCAKIPAYSFEVTCSTHDYNAVSP